MCRGSKSATLALPSSKSKQGPGDRWPTRPIGWSLIIPHPWCQWSMKSKIFWLIFSEKLVWRRQIIQDEGKTCLILNSQDLGRFWKKKQICKFLHFLHQFLSSFLRLELSNFGEAGTQHWMAPEMWTSSTYDEKVSQALLCHGGHLRLVSHL